MSRVINIQSAITAIPSGYVTGSNFTTNTNYPITNGYTNSASTTYARFSLTNGAAGYIYYTFGNVSIPQNATITNVICGVRVYINNTSSVTNTSAQLYAGTTQKGNSSTFASTRTTNVITVNGGTSWTTNELSNIRLRIGGTGSGSNNQNRYIYFYGADLIVNYSLNGVEYEVTASSEYDGASLGPESQFIFQGGDAVVRIDTDALDNMVLEDNGSDVTENLQYTIPQVPNPISVNPSSFDSTNTSVTGSNTTNGCAAETTTTTATFSATATAGATTSIYYTFSPITVPSNATIASITCRYRASWPGGNGTNNAGTTYFSSRKSYLCYGTTKKGNGMTITNTTSSQTAIDELTDTGSWTPSELSNIKLLLEGVHQTGNTQAVTVTFWGATLTINYTVPQTPYYQYTVSNISADHDIVFREAIIIPPEEDPDIEYHSVTISSINATTEPGRGTTRVESGTNETITIYPSDPKLTLVTDNGVDITSQLVVHGGTIPNPTVTTVNGASYGFTLNSSTGYYTSANKGVDKSAAVCRVSFNLPVRCLVTINYINYAEATYDFGVFGDIDTSLSTNYYAAGSDGATITDNDYKLACRTSSYNTSSVQTITYEIPSGEHYIDIKFSKDDATSSNNDTLQWKIASIEPLENNNYYTYNLNGVNSDHSLVFIFGDVTYYFVNSSTDNENARLYPQGSMVYLPGDTYKLTIVPQNDTDEVTVYDNGTNVSGSLERKEITTEKDGVSSTTVNYNYYLNNIQSTHNISVSVVPLGSAFLKMNGSWTKVTVYKKINGEWELQRIEDDIFDDGIIYINN